MSRSREQKSCRLRRIREQVNENFSPLREAVIPLSPSLYVPLGAFSSLGLDLEKYR